MSGEGIAAVAGEEDLAPAAPKVHLGLPEHVLASAVGGLIARAATYPLDTMKTILQVHTPRTPVQPMGIARASFVKEMHWPLAEAIKRRGVLSLYQGVGIACLLGTPALSLYYTTYDKSKELLCTALGREESTGIHVASATMAEVVSGVIWTPMELVKQKLQVKGSLTKGAASPATGSSVVAASGGVDGAGSATAGLVQRIHEKHGWGGFYRGYLLGLMVFVPFSACYFIAYENLKAAMIRRHLEEGAHPFPGEQVELSFMEYMSASAVSAVLGSAIANPMDVVKTRWQVNRQFPASVTSPWQLIVHMYKREGMASFAKGLGARATYTAPYVAISMAIYELIKLRLS